MKLHSYRVGRFQAHDKLRNVAKPNPFRAPKFFVAAKLVLPDKITPSPINLDRTRTCVAEKDVAIRDMSAAIDLKNIRNSLIRQEDTIIFNFIERAQFARNEVVYVPHGMEVPGYNKDGQMYSLLEYILRETEQLHGKVRRYTSPDEHAFFPDDLPSLVLPPISYPNVLSSCAESINFNTELLDVYITSILADITTPGDDFNYGSAATLDLLCLQALSKRIHYGKFVAEAKFRAHTEQYTKLIEAGDAEGIMELLTDRAVEKRVLERVALKAATFGQEVVSAPVSPTSPLGTAAAGPSKYKVKPEVVAKVYEQWVMPLTKKVEVEYLLRRLEDGCPADL